MHDLNRYEGVIPAFYACYDDAGEVSPERTMGLARFLLAKGMKGLYVCGSSGECIYQSVDERMRILKSVMAAVGGQMTIIAHVAANSTRDSVKLAAHAQRLGVDAIAAIPPIYFKLPERAIAAYWNAISDAAPDTDFFIYNIPQLAGVALTPSLFTQMRQNPRVVGVKNSSMPPYDIETFASIGGENCVIFNGPDEQFLAGRLMGARGGIGGTYGAMPELFLRLDALIREGNAQQGAALQSDINRIIEALCAGQGCMYALIKEVLARRGVPCGGVRAPFYPYQPGDAAQVSLCLRMIDEAIAKHCA